MHKEESFPLILIVKGEKLRVIIIIYYVSKLDVTSQVARVDHLYLRLV